MNKLAMELERLYGAAPQGQTRSVCLAFRRLKDDGEAGHWERLCAVANALQAELGLPAPAVSVSGDGAFGLWLALEQALPVAQAQDLIELVCARYCPELQPAPGAAAAPPALPPQLHAASGKWAAFIHPGMGASFAGDEGLEMAPPEAGQVALLEGLECIGAALLAQALGTLRQPARGAAPPPGQPAGAAREGLLLKDATLEDIVAFLHAKHIEPTFRFLK